MRTDILFTIVIPTYNRADLILETLESVFGQTYKSYEVIVVDNCSTDNTEEILLPLVKGGKIRYIKHAQNFERSRSRNTGMQQAKGDFLTFLDSDDFMYKDCLLDAFNYIESNPEVKFFHNLYELVNNNRDRVHLFDFPKLNNQYKALASGNFISCIGGFIHKDIYTTHRFNEDPQMIGSEDYEVWFQVAAKYKLGRINKVNSGIREHPKRSVNQGVLNNLDYQRGALVNNIRNDQLLYEKFGSYLPRLNSSFLLLQSGISKKVSGRICGIKKILSALATDYTILTTKRFYKVLYNIIK